jgi:hypothetical protein
VTLLILAQCSTWHCDQVCTTFLAKNETSKITPFMTSRILIGVFSLLVSHIALAQSACNNADDLTHVYKENTSLAAAMESCSGLSGLDRDCFDQTYPGLSGACLGCFADMAGCTVSNCAGTCAFHGSRSSQCKDCSVNTCGGALESCSGLPSSYWPEF